MFKMIGSISEVTVNEKHQFTLSIYKTSMNSKETSAKTHTSIVHE